MYYWNWILQNFRIMKHLETYEASHRFWNVPKINLRRSFTVSQKHILRKTRVFSARPRRRARQCCEAQTEEVSRSFFRDLLYLDSKCSKTLSSCHLHKIVPTIVISFTSPHLLTIQDSRYLKNNGDSSFTRNEGWSIQCKEVVIIVVMPSLRLSHNDSLRFIGHERQIWWINLLFRHSVRWCVLQPTGSIVSLELLNIFPFKWSATFVRGFQSLMCFWDRVPPSTSEAVISWNKEATEARSISKLHKPCWTIYCRTLSTLLTSRLTLQNRWWWFLNTSWRQLRKQTWAWSNASS